MASPPSASLLAAAHPEWTAPLLFGRTPMLFADEKPGLRPERRRVPEGEDTPSPLPHPAPWTSPSLLDLLPELSADEKARLRQRGQLPEGAITPCHYLLPTPWLKKDNATIISTVRDVLDHYNARHPGGEFDVVTPLTRDRLHFRGQVWFHMNFWARSRSSKMIKRFFAEVHVHYKPPTCSDMSFPGPPITTVESCTILEEPLSQYRSNCAFCDSHMDILHPMDDQFLCGNGDAKDWMIKKIFGMRFITRYEDLNSQGGGNPWDIVFNSELC